MEKKEDSNQLQPISYPDYIRLAEELRYSNRFSIPKDLEEIIKRYTIFNLNNRRHTLRKGVKYYRARINSLGQENSYSVDEMGAPPKGKAVAGRINPEGISYLYLGDSVDTVISEVRPWSDAKVSVATFELQKDVEVISLHDRSIVGSNHGDSIELKDLVIDAVNQEGITAQYFSTPVHRDDSLAYLPSQYLVELFKKAGMDGIKYGSALNIGGYNLALFDVTVAKCIEDIQLHSVTDVKYTSRKISPK